MTRKDEESQILPEKGREAGSEELDGHCELVYDYSAWSG